jgi:hypothetical protein
MPINSVGWVSGAPKRLLQDTAERHPGPGTGRPADTGAAYGTIPSAGCGAGVP